MLPPIPHLSKARAASPTNKRSTPRTNWIQIQQPAPVTQARGPRSAAQGAPPTCGSGRSNDFFNQHIQRLAEIYERAGGKVALGRRNPRREHPRGTMDSAFFQYCLAINQILPRKLKRSFNGGPSDGIAMSVRRAAQKTNYLPTG